MMRYIRLVAAAATSVLAVGCTNSNIFVDLPILSTGASSCQEQNPYFISLGPNQYGLVFEKVLQTLSDFGFEVPPGDSNRYDGRIEALPRVAPGLGLLLKAGSPNMYERLLATTQTYRHRLTVLIQPANQGGFFIEFIARKELEDLSRPIRSTVGGSVFRTENTAERQTEVIDTTYFDSAWIFKGRDVELEQELIRRFKVALSQ
jgi:hypothetical protein